MDTKSVFFKHHDYTIVEFVYDNIVVDVYVDVSMDYKADGGVSTSSVDMTKKPTNIITSNTINCTSARSHLVLHVTCTFSQIIYPGWSWHGLTYTIYPFNKNYSGIVLRHKQYVS